MCQCSTVLQGEHLCESQRSRFRIDVIFCKTLVRCQTMEALQYFCPPSCGGSLLLRSIIPVNFRQFLLPAFNFGQKLRGSFLPGVLVAKVCEFLLVPQRGGVWGECGGRLVCLWDMR